MTKERLEWLRQSCKTSITLAEVRELIAEIDRLRSLPITREEILQTNTPGFTAPSTSSTGRSSENLEGSAISLAELSPDDEGNRRQDLQEAQ